MAKKRVADVLVDTLLAVGVKRVYGLVGDSLNGITDSIRLRKDLHESAILRGQLFLAIAVAHARNDPLRALDSLVTEVKQLKSIPNQD